MYSQPKFTIKTNISLIEVVSNQRFLPVSVDKSSRKLSRAIFLKKGAKKSKSSFSNLERGSVDGVPAQTRRHDCLGEKSKKWEGPISGLDKTLPGISQILKSSFSSRLLSTK